MRLFLGDCLDVMKLLPSASVDMVLCDLPYGVTTRNKWDCVIPWKPLWSEYTRIAKENAAIVLTSKKQPLRNHEQILVFYRKQPTYNPQKTNGHPRKVSTAAHKINCVNTTNYGEHGLTTYDSTERYPKTVLVFPSDKQSSALHPTQKPVALMEYLIKTYTNEGDTVLDNCMGSGTTGVACANLGRNFIGIEKDRKYFEIAKTRLGS